MNISYMAIPGLDRKLLQIVVPKQKKFEIIKSVVCDCYSVTEECMMSRIRERECSDARHVVVHFLGALVGCGPVDIGRIMKREHTFAIYARNKVTDLIYSDPNFKRELRLIRSRIENEIKDYKKLLSENPLQLPQQRAAI